MLRVYSRNMPAVSSLSNNEQAASSVKILYVLFID
jgi:hypothetical protein